MASRGRNVHAYQTRRSSSVSRSIYTAGLIFVLLLVFAVSNVTAARLGLEFFLYALVGLLFGSIYGYISFRSLPVPFFLFILSVGLLRFVWAIEAPILPDLYLDRMSLIWLAIVFMISAVAGGRKMRGPWGLDLLILAHGSYILIRILTQDFFGFHTWTMSVMIPYAAYFFAKNIIVTKKQIHGLMVVLLILVIYYSITSIAEKFHIPQLLYPKYMIEPHKEFIGRSTGPFRNSGIFGNAIGMLLPVHLYFIAKTSRIQIKVLLMLSMAFGLGGLFFSYTRGSWLSGTVGLATVVALNPRQYLRPFVPLMIVVPIIALFFLGMGQDEFMKERAENDDTVGARFGVAITAVRVWRDYPIFGCGAFRYNEVRDDYIEPISVPGLGTLRFAQYRGNSIHDIYMGPMAEDGLVGTAMTLSIYFLFFRVLWRKYKWRLHGDDYATYVLPIFAGIWVSYLIGGLTISYRNTSILGMLFFMAAGVAAGYQRESNGDSPLVEDGNQGKAYDVS